MTGTFLLDALGVAILALCALLFGIALLGILGTYVYAVWQDLTGKRYYDQRDYSRSPDWPE